MPLPRDMLAAMRKKYGDKKAEGVIHAWGNAHPDSMAKALRTARRKGHGGVVSTSVRRKKRRGRKVSR